MKKEETFDEWFDRVYGWYKKNKAPNIDTHSEKISYSKAGEDKHIIEHAPQKEEHIIEHGEDHHELPKTDTLPIPDDEKSLQEWIDKIHKVWEEHS